jgi:hypothetical protein
LLTACTREFGVRLAIGSTPRHLLARVLGEGAAIGISEQTDAIVIVVSEETGSISLVMRGRIERNLTEEKLRRRIFHLIRPQAPRRAVPFLRRTLEGRWGFGDEVEEESAPLDPEERVIGSGEDDQRDHKQRAAVRAREHRP